MSNQITFRGMAPDEVTMQRAFRMADRLEGHVGGISRCAVLIQRSTPEQRGPVRYHVSLQLQRTAPGEAMTAGPSATDGDLGKALSRAFRRADTTFNRRIGRRRSGGHVAATVRI